MSSLTEFLFPAPASRSPGAIVGWWEGRRLFYNVAVGAAGSASYVVMSVVDSILQGTPHLVPWPFVVMFGLGANVMYCLGPTLEILIDKIWGRTVLPVGPSLYRMGLTFSVGLALFPCLIMTIALVGWSLAKLLG
ncbi:MAG: hypothetical protein FJ207_04960 [Gemmatimonadetes bacterium]|nr:hypothetical protein [Gemmatimonadota bacterium]